MHSFIYFLYIDVFLLVLCEEQVNRDEIVSDILRGQDLILFLDPVLFLGNVPIELPQLPALLQPQAPLDGQLHQLSIGVLQLLHALQHHRGLARPVAFHLWGARGVRDGR